MHDFTFHALYQLLNSIKKQQFIVQPFMEFIRNPVPKFVILRHDVDKKETNSLLNAQIENLLGIVGTYYFRIVSGSFDENVIRRIYDLGHEIGYHYEDLAIAKGDHKKAIMLFEQNLAKLRRIVPVETICMHGSPLSRWDNRQLWKYYDYRDFGIIGEPYFDIDFDEVLYLTDTGRRWDGESVSVRDKVENLRGVEGIEKQIDEEAVKLSLKTTITKNQGAVKSTEDKPDIRKFHSTFDIIDAAESGTLPEKIMLTVHPQRWNNDMLPWLKELIWQNAKNNGKWILNYVRNNNV
ncbi:MAG: hypothetical protein GX431_14020 [Bacteroidales bacterium]|jgi:hypothetical protein|nr:hypothetical protein [Bacteroidales bacterium]